MTALQAFLRAEDLDELVRLKGALASLTPEDSARITAIIMDWKAFQAVANLLFHPELIPQALRFKAIDRALHSIEVPYLRLAATVGLQDIPWSDLPIDRRQKWVVTLQELLQSPSPLLAGRASVTLYSWATNAMSSDILPEILSRFPVFDPSACRNIVAAVLTNYGELSADDFAARLSEWHVSANTKALLKRAHDDYRALKDQNEVRALVVKSPTFAYIPNLVAFR